MIPEWMELYIEIMMEAGFCPRGGVWVVGHGPTWYHGALMYESARDDAIAGGAPGWSRTYRWVRRGVR